MTAPQIMFPVGLGSSSIVTAADRSRLLALSTAIYEHVGHYPSACWYPIRCQYIHGPSCFLLDTAGPYAPSTSSCPPTHDIRLATHTELAQKLPTGTLILPVADFTDAFYLTLFLFDDLALKPTFDPEQIIVPASIRHGLGVFLMPMIPTSPATAQALHPAFRPILPYLRPIERLILDPEISEIMINSPSDVFIEKHGVLERIQDVTISADQLRVAVQNIARSLGDDISEEKPILDSRLLDGSRIAAVLPRAASRALPLPFVNSIPAASPSKT